MTTGHGQNANKQSIFFLKSTLDFPTDDISNEYVFFVFHWSLLGSSRMPRPGKIPHALKGHFHNSRSCIDIREGRVHAVKANTHNRKWHNVVTVRGASIAVNTRTVGANRALTESTEPFHMVTFGSGADTFYWGQYRYETLGRHDGQLTFELKYVGPGDMQVCLPAGAKECRSRLETRWEAAFEVSGTPTTYEPATLKLPSTELLPDKEYTPDYWLPEAQTFIEIKGPPPTEEEFEKCRLSTELGFRIKMFRGGPDGFDCHDWDSNGKRTTTHHASWYRYLHPGPQRKRRKIHNVSHTI
jgi:hypothetical protein